jgi:hypothetical protein
MRATFTQKVMLTILAGFFAACLIQFYKKVVIEGDQAVNGGYHSRTGISADH